MTLSISNCQINFRNAFFLEDIILDDGSVLLPDGIRKLWFDFDVLNQTLCIFLYYVRFCLELDTKLISPSMLDQKSLIYLSSKAYLILKYNSKASIKGQINFCNFH